MTGQELYDKASEGSGFKCSCDPMLDRIRSLGDKIKIAEIGVCKGLGMWRMLTECPNIEMAIGIDIWWSEDGKLLEYLKTAREVLDPFIGKSLKLIVDTSHKAHEIFPDKYFDYVFIDGDHGYEGCAWDIEFWAPKVRSGGILAGHDYKHNNGVTKAVKVLGEVKKPGGWVWYKEMI